MIAQKDTKRIEFEVAGAMIVYTLHNSARSADGDKPGRQMISDYWVSFCDKLKAEGFAVWMYSQDKGRAVRGEITRIDFVLLPSGWKVLKYCDGWTATTPPISTDIKPEEFDASEAVEWCKSNGWTVVEWENGARAFKGEPLPVHSASDIRRLRNEHPQSQSNLAFYY